MTGILDAAIATGRLPLRLVDAETWDPIFGMERQWLARAGVRWHKQSEGAWWRSANLMPLGNDLAYAELPVGRVDLEFCLQHLGYRPTSRSCRVHAADAGPGSPLEIRLERGCEVRFVVDDLPGIRAAMGERRLFVVADGQSETREVRLVWRLR